MLAIIVGLVCFAAGFLTSIWFSKNNKNHYEKIRGEMDHFFSHTSEELSDEAKEAWEKIRNKF